MNMGNIDTAKQGQLHWLSSTQCVSRVFDFNFHTLSDVHSLLGTEVQHIRRAPDWRRLCYCKYPILGIHKGDERHFPKLNS